MKKIVLSFLLVILPFVVSNAHPTRIYLIGEATPNGWSLDAAPLMERVSDGVYEWVGNLNGGSLKFLSQKDWVPSYGPTENNTLLAAGAMDLALRTNYEDPDNAFSVTAGRWLLRVDLTGETPQIIVADGTGLADKGYATYSPLASIYAIGDATAAGWTIENAIEMKETTTNSGMYAAVLNLNKEGELKFLNQKDWGNGYGATILNTPITGAGEYDIATLDADDKKFVTKIAAATDYEVIVDVNRSKLIVKNTYDSKSGHYIYFKNTDNAWTNVYLRIGRADHVYTQAFEPIAGTDWWRCETPDYDNYTHFTITDNADATAPVATYPDGAYRLYEYSYDLTEDRWFVLTDGPNANGTHYYWNNTSDLHEYTVYLVPEELNWVNGWTNEKSVHLELNWTDIPAVRLNKEVKMSPIKNGSHIYKGIIKIPFEQVYGMNFKLYEETTYIETYAIYYDAYYQAPEWNGKLISHAKNDDWNQRWFDYPAPEYTVEAGHTIYFDNTKTKWAQPYLRVGRAKAHGYSGNHVHSYPFTRVGTTDIWTLTTEEYTGAEAWTISNVNQSSDENVYSAGFGVGGKQRVFYFKESIDKDICVKVTESAAYGTDAWGVAYWGCEITDENPIYTRNVTVGRYGTICLPQASAACSGADFYTVVGKELKDGDPTSIVIETVSSLQAGVPYLFYAKDNLLAVALTGEVAAAAGSSNGMIGSFVEDNIVDSENHYILLNNELCKVNQSKVGANRAYFDLSQMRLFDPAQPAQGVRQRMGVSPQGVAAGVDEITGENMDIRKAIVNGQLVIIQGKQMYNAQGQVIK